MNVVAVDTLTGDRAKSRELDVWGLADRLTILAATPAVPSRDAGPARGKRTNGAVRLIALCTTLDGSSETVEMQS